MQKYARLTALALVALTATPAAAHHSTAAYFDVNSQITVEGTVEEFVFKAPHAVLKFMVTNKDGQEELWRGETLPANLLFRKGWRYNMFEVGERITVTGMPAKDPERHALEVQKIVTEDGTEYSPFK